jgi:erythronate-4-phosphate dehydrogenase
MSIRILADRHLQNLEQLLPDEAELHFFEPAGTLPEAAPEFDALLIRTVSKIDRNILPETGHLRFIGTATAGYDHIDTRYLSEKGVAFARSEGCNARSVGEYVITCLLYWANLKNELLTHKKVGIVGCGHTGSFVSHFLQRLGIEQVGYDLPKEAREPGFRSASLEELFDCDILTFHTPLIRSGPHPTHHLGNRAWFKHSFDLVINSARGGVVCEEDLIDAKQSGYLRDIILDVWEGEPLFADQTAEEAFIATPHIAGYSAEAKFRASQIVTEKLCRHFNLPAQPAQAPVTFSANNYRFEPGWPAATVLWENNRIKEYDRELRKLIGKPAEIKGDAFAQLRTRQPLRHEYLAMRRQLHDNTPGASHLDLFKDESDQPKKRSTTR